MRMKPLAGAVCAGMCLFALGQVQAATKVDVHAKKLGRVAPTQLASHLNLRAGSSLVAAHTVRLHDGKRLVRQRQVYKGVPVYGRSVVVERGARGNVLRVDGRLERDLATELGSVQPRLDADQARYSLRRARGQLRQSTRGGKATLYVYPGTAGAPARLVYRVSYLVGSGNHISRPTAIIDADTGKVIKQWNGLTTGRRPRGGGTPTPVQATGPGGNNYTGVYFYDGSGPGRDKLEVTRVGTACYMQNPEVATYDLAGGQRVTLASFGCRGNNPAKWVSSGDGINGAFSAVNDAHHFGQVVNEMYKTWFNQPALTLNGQPMQLQMWVHYGTQYQNAFWDGSEMVFGDGSQLFFPFVSLDVTGHEISHGFTEQHSGLEYIGQSGGMNEAFSDMAGQAVVYFDTGSNDFLVGEDIVKAAAVPVLGMHALRDMCQPSRDGQSIGNAADYYPGLDVHYSSGVYNKAFCTLAKTTGWNTRKAFEVFHDANALYWGPTETFDSGACGVEQAADDRGYSQSDVQAAFSAVGVACSDPGAAAAAHASRPTAPQSGRQSAGRLLR